MRLFKTKDDVNFTLSHDEALVLFEMLQRLVEDNERQLLPLLHSSAEFAVLCAMNSQLEKALPESLLEEYEDLVARARKALVKQNGHYEGIEEK